MFSVNYMVTLERKAEPMPRRQFTVPFYAIDSEEIRTSLEKQDLLHIIQILPVPEYTTDLAGYFSRNGHYHE